ncbi:MAG: hypothetical protein R3B06_11095 [Kofleriaceae bacterium]
MRAAAGLALAALACAPAAPASGPPALAASPGDVPAAGPRLGLGGAGAGLPPLARAPTWLDPVPARLVARGAAVSTLPGVAVAVWIDPLDGERLVIQVEAGTDAAPRAGLAAFDLHADRWRWARVDGCAPGRVVGVALAGPVVACATQAAGVAGAAVTALATDTGITAWTWRGHPVEQVRGAGSVVALAGAEQVTLLDAASGGTLAHWQVPAAAAASLVVVARADDTAVAWRDGPRIVQRARRAAWQPTAATIVDGEIALLTVVGDRVAVALADGTLYFLAGDGAAVSAGSLAAVWSPAGDRAAAVAPVPGGARLLAVDPAGIPRAEVAVAGAAPGVVVARASVAGAPLVWVDAAGRGTVVVEGRSSADVVDLGPGPPPAFATVVDGVPVAGAVLGEPVRVVEVAAPGR